MPILFILLSFLWGSIPFGFLLGKLKGIDLRREGSGNIGATNVWRVLGPAWGLPAFLLDFSKGLLPVLVTKAVLPEESVTPWLIACGIAAILGHNYTPWLGFKGGKGIATSAGVLAGLLPLTLAVVFATWAVLVLATGIVSIGSITACLLLLPVTWWLHGGDAYLLTFAGVAGALGLWRHRANFGRLMRGEEPSFRNKRKS